MADGVQRPLGRARGRARPKPTDESSQLRGTTPAAPPRSGPMAMGGIRPEAHLTAGRGAVIRSAGGNLPSTMAALNIAGSSSSDSGSTKDKTETSSTSDTSEKTAVISGEGDKAVNSPVGRGAVRGVKVRNSQDLLWTKPKEILKKQGKDGKTIECASNYFALKSMPNWNLYQHRVDYFPDVDHTGVRKGLMRSLRDKLDVEYIFDGTLLFAIKELGHTNQPLVLKAIKESDKTEIQVTIKLVGQVKPTDYHYLQFFNIVLRNCMEELNLDLIGRNYFDSKAAVDDPNVRKHKLDLWPGYVTSIRQHENQILLCADITHKILRTDTVLDQLKLASRERDFHASAEKLLIGQIVITRYNNNTYRVDDIDWESNVSQTFDNKKGDKVKYVEYYESKYGLKIKDLKQPLLISMPKMKDRRSDKPSGPVYLIPELCHMTGLSEQQRANFSLMKDVGEYTRCGPDKKYKALEKFAHRMATTKTVQTKLQTWGLEFDQKLQRINARTLPPEQILGSIERNVTFSYQEFNADWGAAFRRWTCFSVAQCTKWAVIYGKRDEMITKQFVKCLVDDAAKGLGMNFKNPKYECLNETRFVDYMKALDTIIDLKPNMVMVVIPNNKGEVYSMIKKKTCIERPVPSQVMTATILSKEKMIRAVACKVAIQINCKLGGEPWSVKIPLKGAMVCGYDTYHDTQQKGKSVGAFVASMNPTLTKYWSVTDFHMNFEEMSNNVTANLLKAVHKYATLNRGQFPDKIFIYRDGVGDGQINFVYEHELKNMLLGLKSIGVDIKLTFIIVSKRVNTKFFSLTGQIGNVMSGTVVDDVVTLPERYDFFLVSQSVRQGTVNPTSYNVIYDESGLLPNHIQRLSYKLTHLYYNWPGTVRVPAPCQYAHKLAFLVGNSLHTNPSESLNELLYYL